MATKEIYTLKKPGNQAGDAFKVEDVDGTSSIYVNGTKVSATPAELNLNDDIVADISISYAASSTTDGIEATFTVLDAAGTAINAIHLLECYISDDADGSGLTATSASGALTADTGTILTALTAKKHVMANTDANGVLTLLLVDNANTAGERFCVRNPANGKIIVGDATVAGDYEGG